MVSVKDPYGRIVGFLDRNQATTNEVKLRRLSLYCNEFQSVWIS
jgi:hypothetical protein